MRCLILNGGIDVAKNEFVVYLEYLFVDRSTKKAGQRTFKNTNKGIEEFLKWVDKRNRKQARTHFTMEATGRYHESLAYALHENNLSVSIVLPNLIKHFAYSINQYSKSDPIDAQIIAAYTSKYQPKVWQPANISMRQLREYTRERQDITKSKAQTMNRLHALRHSHRPEARTIDRLERQLAFYQNQLQDIEEDIAQLCYQDQRLNEDIELLTSIPHIGFISACTILAETGGFVLFKNRSQLIKYAGMDVIEKQSGSSVNGRGRISKRGNSYLRTAPFMGAINAISHESIFHETYLRHLEKHGVKTKAITAVVRQLLKVAYGVYKSRQRYDQNIHLKRVGEHKDSPTVARLKS